MKTKKLFGIMVLTVILAMFTVLSLTGCGDNDSTNGEKSSDTSDVDTSNVDTPGGSSWKVEQNGYTGKWGLDVIAFGSGKFVTYFGEGNSDIKMSTSTDGITWTAGTDSALNDLVKVIAYGNGIFVAGGTKNSMSYSSDGKKWTAVKSVPTGDSNATIKAIAYGNGRFVAGGSTDGSKVIYSTDGITWTATDAYALGNTLGLPNDIGKRNGVYAIAYGGGNFVAIGKNNIAYSTDGITWINKTTSSLGLGSISISAIAYGSGVFVAVGGVTTKKTDIVYSSDGGITWTAVTDTTAFDYPYNGGTSNAIINAIAYGNGKFVVGGAKGKLATSPDGITWTALPDNTFGIPDDSSIGSIAYGNGKFVVAGTDYALLVELESGKIICLPGN